MPETYAGVIRHLLTFVGGFAIARGWVDESQVAEASGIVISIIAFVWSWKSKKAAK